MRTSTMTDNEIIDIAKKAGITWHHDSSLRPVDMEDLREFVKQAGLAARNEWQPIETAPKGLVLLYWPPTKPSKNHQSNILLEMIRVDHARSTPNRLPTHWMPLPQPPI